MAIGSSNFDTNFSQILKTERLITKEISLDSLTIDNGKILGLNDPIFDDEIANRGYVDELYNVPMGPNKGILLRQNNEFQGSNDLIFNNDTLEIVDEFQIVNGTSTVTIKSDIIDNVQDPVENDNAVNRNYTINFDNFTTVEIVGIQNSTIGHTYSADELLNRIVLRNLNQDYFTEFNLTGQPNIRNYKVFREVLPSAKNIINQIDFPFKNKKIPLIVVNSGLAIPAFSFVSNESVTVQPTNLPIYGQYVAKITIILKNIIPENEEIIFNIESISHVNLFNIPNLGFVNPQWPLLIRDNGLLGQNLKVDQMLVYPIVPIVRENDSHLTYTFNDLKSGFVIRGASLTQNVSDTVQSAASILNNSEFRLGENESSTGGWEFRIFNVSGFNITLGSSVSSIGITFDQDSSFTIPPDNTGIFVFIYNLNDNTINVFTKKIVSRS